MDPLLLSNISIIIPVRNGGPDFMRCLSSLKRLDPVPLEIIVVADGCTDDTPSIASKAGAQVIELPQSNGPARARNIGALRAKGDLLFFIDADVAVPSDAIKQVAHAFQKDPQPAAVIGAYDDSPFQTNFLSQYKNLLHHYIHQTAREKASTFWGACGVIKRDVFFKMGGFYEAYLRPSIEDIDLGYRLVKSGFRIQLIKSLQVKHLKGWDAASLFKSDVLDRAVPWTHLILRDRGFINDLNTDINGRLSVILVYGFLLSFPVAIGWPGALFVTGATGIMLLLINLPVYRFFKIKRGLCFALKTVPWHWFYFFYCGIGFVLGIISYGWREIKYFSKNGYQSHDE